MRNGARPTRLDHLDRSYHKTFGTFGTTTFPAEFFTDAGIDMPDQNQINTQFVPAIPALPYGCTDYTSADIATDLVNGKTLFNPETLDVITNANASGGIDIRVSLLAAKKLGWIQGFYNVQSAGFYDFFDSFRLAQLGGSPEKRSISWGTPWFPSWETACNPTVNPSGILPMPTDAELAAAKQNPNSLEWHNSKLDGFTTINGILVYRNKSWQGNIIGQKGFVYFPREVINTVMTISGTVGYIGTNQTPGAIATIDVTAVQWIVSIVRHLLGLQ